MYNVSFNVNLRNLHLFFEPEQGIIKKKHMDTQISIFFTKNSRILVRIFVIVVVFLVFHFGKLSKNRNQITQITFMEFQYTYS